MIRRVNRELAAQGGPPAFLILHLQYGHCPGGCRDGLQGPTGRVYRSSRRSVTLQCTICTLQWTMTVHRIAQVAARKAEAPEASRDLKVAAQVWAEWASHVDERRGRRKA